MTDTEFDALYARCAERVRRYCERTLGPVYGADAAADTWMRAWIKRDTCTGCAPAWVWAIARNQCRMHFRDRWVRNRRALSDFTPAHTSIIERLDVAMDVEHLLADEPETVTQALRRRCEGEPSTPNERLALHRAVKRARAKVAA